MRDFPASGRRTAFRNSEGRMQAAIIRRLLLIPLLLSYSSTLREGMFQ